MEEARSRNFRPARLAMAVLAAMAVALVPAGAAGASGAPRPHGTIGSTGVIPAAGPIGSTGAIRAAGATGGWQPHGTTRSAMVGPRTPETTTGADLLEIDNGTDTVASYTNQPVALDPTCPNQPSELCLDIGGGIGQFDIQNPSDLVAGTTYYSSGALGGFSFTLGDCGQGGSSYPFTETLELDHFQWTTTLDTFGAQLYCSNADFTVVGSIALSVANTTPNQGYYLFDKYGDTYGFGNDSYLTYLGNPGFLDLNAPVVSMVPTPDGGGYWMTAGDGGVFAYGDAQFYGSTGNIHLNKPVVGMAATPDGKGYWFVASDGGVFSYGDAGFYGSTGNIHLAKPVVGMASTPDGKGYWLVAADGGVFAFGDAHFYGSAGNIHLAKPIVGMTPTPDGKGYWFVASDGGVFSYGDAHFYGSAGNIRLSQPVTGMLTSPDGRGYSLVADDGGLFCYGDAQFSGSLGGEGITGVVGMVR